MTIRLFTIFYVGLILTLVFMVDQGKYINLINFVHQIPFGDKIGHFILVGLLAFSINLSLHCSTFQLLQQRILKGSFIVFIFITLEEGSQYFIASRHFDLGDLLANYIGILFFSWLALLIKNSLKLKSSPEAHSELGK
jgi:VanZ family protein